MSPGCPLFSRAQAGFASNFCVLAEWFIFPSEVIKSLLISSNCFFTLGRLQYKLPIGDVSWFGSPSNASSSQFWVYIFLVALVTVPTQWQQQPCFSPVLSKGNFLSLGSPGEAISDLFMLPPLNANILFSLPLPWKNIHIKFPPSKNRLRIKGDRFLNSCLFLNCFKATWSCPSAVKLPILGNFASLKKKVLSVKWKQCSERLFCFPQPFL